MNKYLLFLLFFFIIHGLCSANYRLEYDKSLTKISGELNKEGYWTGDAIFSSSIGKIHVKDKVSELEISINDKPCIILTTEGGWRSYGDFEAGARWPDQDPTPTYILAIHEGKLTIDARGLLLKGPKLLHDNTLCVLINTPWNVSPRCKAFGGPCEW